MTDIEKKALALVNEVRELLIYEADTGELFWRERGPHLFAPFTKRVASRAVTVSPEQQAKMWNTKYANKRAGTPNKDGYLSINFKGKFVLAHRLVWVLHNGDWPQHEIDHLNGDPRDNRIENLRDVPHAINMHNMAVHREALVDAETYVTKRGGLITLAALAARGGRIVWEGE